jgi:hypothetical protein
MAADNGMPRKNQRLEENRKNKVKKRRQKQGIKR